MIDVEDQIDDLLKCAETDYVGLWMIVADYRDELGSDDIDGIMNGTLSVVRGLVAKGLCPIDYGQSGIHFWTGTTDEMIARIEREWRDLPEGLPRLQTQS